MLSVKQNTDYITLNQKVYDLQKETNSKISELTDGIKNTNNLISTEVGSLNKELNLVKATAGDDFSGIIDSSIPSVVTIKTSAGLQQLKNYVHSIDSKNGFRRIRRSAICSDILQRMQLSIWQINL